MSVLLDALKKSEEEKKKAESQEASVQEATSDAEPEQKEASQTVSPPVAAAPKPITDPPKPAGAPSAGGLGKLGMFSQAAKVPSKPPAVHRPAPPPGGAGMAPPPPVAPSKPAPSVSSGEAGGQPKPSVAPASAPASVAPSPAVTPSLAKPKPKAATFDFDALDDPKPQPGKSISASSAGSSPSGAAKTVAESVVGAGKSTIDVERAQPSSPAKKSPLPMAIAATVVIAAAGGAAYFLLSPPGVAPAPTQNTQFQSDSDVVATEESEPADLLPLPSPNIDIQSELVNFASFTNDFQQPSASGDQSVADRIAILTSSFLESTAPLIEEEEDEVVEVDLSLSPEEVVEVVEEEIALDPSTLPVESAARSRASLAQRLSETDLGSGVRLYAVAGSDDTVANASTGAGDGAGEPVEIATTAPALSVTPSEKSDVIARLLAEAKRDYDEGNLAGAEVTFRKILSDDSNNLNAMKGLAMVASETGRYRLAASVYLKVLDLKPDDAIAISELISLHARQPDYRLTEQRLKSLIGRVPSHDDRIFFALGNFYAEQGRWIEAQESYFRAFGADSGNPDYAFNLAVSLEYLNRQDIALNYYRTAQELAANSPHSFDNSVLTSRILQLEN